MRTSERSRRGRRSLTLHPLALPVLIAMPQPQTNRSNYMSLAAKGTHTQRLPPTAPQQHRCSTPPEPATLPPCGASWDHARGGGGGGGHQRPQGMAMHVLIMLTYPGELRTHKHWPWAGARAPCIPFCFRLPGQGAALPLHQHTKARRERRKQGTNEMAGAAATQPDSQLAAGCTHRGAASQLSPHTRRRRRRRCCCSRRRYC